MIVLVNPIVLYGKKVVTDLASRTGYHTRDDFSYGLGMSFQVAKWWSGDETEANIEMLFNAQTDFDADVAQPHLSEEEYDANREQEEFEKGAAYNPARDKTSFDKYKRRLEDVASDYLEAYMGNLVYTVCRRNDGVKSFNSKHLIQPTLVSDGDDSGDITELADLQLRVNDEDWSLDVKQEALSQLPYVIKRLHNLSCYCGVHMLSYISSYVIAKEKNENMRSLGSQKTMKKNAVIEEGVYLCDNQGNIKKQVFVQNKNRRAEEMFAWITGTSQEYPSYFKDYLNFVHYCDVLNIDLKDDMTKYQKDFVDKLVVTTVTPNDQYDVQVMNAIVNNSTTVQKSSIDIDPIESTVNTFLQIITTDTVLKDVAARHDSVKEEVYFNWAVSLDNLYYMYYTQTLPSDEKYTWRNGYLFHGDQLVIISANMLSGENSQRFEDDRCIIHELGYCIQVSTLMSLYIMPINCAMENVRNKISTKDPTYKYADWMRMGT